MSTECCIPQYESCCCTCKHRLEDYHHCTTTTAEFRKEHGDGCVCSIPKGWICRPPEFEGRCYSGWSEHGICEMHTPKVR